MEQKQHIKTLLSNRRFSCKCLVNVGNEALEKQEKMVYTATWNRTESGLQVWVLNPAIWGASGPETVSVEVLMKFMENKKLAARIGILTTVITLVGMTLLWLVVSTNAASVVKNDITNQMTDAVESRAAIINEYVLSAEEYMSAFALGSEVRDLLLNPDDPELLAQA